MTKGKVLTIGALIFIMFLITTVLSLLVQMANLSKSISEDRVLYNSELEKSKQLIDELSQNLTILEMGGNEVRRTLNMPDKKLIRKESPVESEETPDPAVSFFEAFRYLVASDEEEKGAADFSIWLNDNRIEEHFSTDGYLFSRKDFFNVQIQKNSITYLKINYDSREENLRFEDISGFQSEQSISENLPANFINSAKTRFNQFEKQIDESIVAIDELMTDEDLQTLLKERELYSYKEKTGNYTIRIAKDKSVIGSVSRDLLYPVLNGKRIDDFNDLKTDLLTFVSTVSNRTEYEQIDDIVLEQMNSIFIDEGFKLLLESNGCKRELARSEDNEFIYFDILNSDGTKKGTFALQKEFGQVLLLSGDGKYLRSLNMFTPDNDFHSLILDQDEEEVSQPVIFDDSSENYLVIGTHERNADTMIIVNANNSTGKIKMISFPRDLYYKGNKINSIYKVYGPERLCSELSQITGLKIEKYVSIDMFAFIDVVNILGGIDVILDEELIDPTYKVINNGIESTLHYRKGTHHLDGVEALRIARSRHGSKAYDRSKRQQLIIEAVIKEMRNLSGKDAGRIYDFTTSVFSYIDTNLTIVDLVRDFLLYKDNEISSPNVIGTDNVLDDEWSNTYLLPEAEKKIAEKDRATRGLWIVLPKNNDWDVFRRYINGILN